MGKPHLLTMDRCVGEHPDATVFYMIACFRDAWLQAEIRWNRIDHADGFGSSDPSARGMDGVSECLEAATDAENMLLNCEPRTIRGCWAYLELIRDLKSQHAIDPEKGISDIDFVHHINNVCRALEKLTGLDKTEDEAAVA